MTLSLFPPVSLTRNIPPFEIRRLVCDKVLTLEEYGLLMLFLSNPYFQEEVIENWDEHQHLLELFESIESKTDFLKVGGGKWA